MDVAEEQFMNKNSIQRITVDELGAIDFEKTLALNTQFPVYRDDTIIIFA